MTSYGTSSTFQGKFKILLANDDLILSAFRFQWVHLNERLAYERISLKQRLRTEISAVKRETNFFAKSIDLSKTLKRKGIIGKGSKQLTDADAVPTTETEVPKDTGTSTKPIMSSKKPSATNPDRAAFFKSLFAKGD